MSLGAVTSVSKPLGYFRVYATPPGGERKEITLFRGAPVTLSNASFVDPFTHETAQLTLPQVTIFDAPGEGDLDWMVPDANIDIVWQNVGETTFTWSWEGYIASENFGISGTSSAYSIDLKGAFYALDDYLAAPTFPRRPIPYEILMAQAFDQTQHPANLGTFRMAFPTWWNLRVPEFTSPDYLLYLKPWGVNTDQLWTGFTSRSTGSWEPTLTGFVQSLLSVMFAEGGAQWTVRNIGNRTPQLLLREIPDYDSPDIIELYVGGPGITITASRDFTQRASVIYGQGVDDAGLTFSGVSISPDGTTTSYTPFAFQPKYWPRTNSTIKGNLTPGVRAKETMIRFQDGVDEISARKIAQGQLQRFAEPGITGSITLTTDLRYQDGGLCPRLLIKAGQTIKLKGLGGNMDGILAHITHSTADFESLTVSLDFDTKYRDQLTVEEVKARTRDALTPLRKIQIGKYSNTINDLILPWSYSEGSGVFPRGAKEFFLEKLPSTATFPYEDFTKQYPPSNPAYAPYYIRMNAPDFTNSNNNWSGEAREGVALMSVPFRMSQTGTIRLSQIAAYDKDGNVLPCRFHVSVYTGNSVATDAMPKFPDDPETAGIKYLKPTGVDSNYGVYQANPFFENAWENVLPDGTPYPNDAYIPAEGAGLVVGWGNYFEPAGYSPGRFSRGAERTGLLSDDSTWTWDLTSTLDVYAPANNANDEYSGMLFVQIYCDDQGSQPVYFMGRFFKQDQT